MIEDDIEKGTVLIPVSTLYSSRGVEVEYLGPVPDYMKDAGLMFYGRLLKSPAIKFDFRFGQAQMYTRKLWKVK